MVSFLVFVFFVLLWYQLLTPTEIPITSPDFWRDENECTEDALRHVFRSATDEEIPLFDERLACLREAGNILYNVRPIFNLLMGS